MFNKYEIQKKGRERHVMMNTISDSTIEYLLVNSAAKSMMILFIGENTQ